MSAGWIACSGTVTGGKMAPLASRPLPETLDSGTLAVEVIVPRGANGALPILHHGTRSPRIRMLTLHLSIVGRLVLTRIDGANRLNLSIDASEALASGGRLRVIYQWDEGQSLLTLEAPEAGVIRQRAGAGVPPMVRDDLTALLNRPAHGPCLDWIAIGDHAQKIGPAACFAPSTPIETPDGPRPAARLRAGDWVETSDAGPQQVLWSGRIDWPALGSFAPVRLAAPSFGLTADLWVLPSHRLAVSGPAIEYHIGRDQLLVAARHLIDNCSASSLPAAKTLGWHGILLREHHLLIADGCQLESLYIGGLGLAPDLMQTTALAELTGQIAAQRPLLLRELSDAEKMVLITARAQARGPIAA